jgi:hypothetical protein
LRSNALLLFLIFLVTIIRDVFISFSLLLSYLIDIFFRFMVLLDGPIPGDLIYRLFAAIAPADHAKAN